MLTVYLDFKCPASFLALHPIFDLVAETGIEVTWKPFRSRQTKIPGWHDDETRGETHRRVRAIQRRDTHKHYAELRGLEMHFRDDPGSSDAALAALTLELKNARRFVRTAFKFYWMSDFDLNDEARVLGLLAASGNFFERDELKAACEAFEDYQTQAEEDGIFTTPTFKLGDQIFVGREHLPLIKRNYEVPAEPV